MSAREAGMFENRTAGEQPEKVSVDCLGAGNPFSVWKPAWPCCPEEVGPAALSRPGIKHFLFVSSLFLL